LGLYFFPTRDAGALVDPAEDGVTPELMVERHRERLRRLADGWLYLPAEDLVYAHALAAHVTNELGRGRRRDHVDAGAAPPAPTSPPQPPATAVSRTAPAMRGSSCLDTRRQATDNESRFH
jgi:hypothetical protein